jgi:integrase
MRAVVMKTHHLDEHLLRTGRKGTDLVFGCAPSQPFTPSTVRNRAIRAWRGGQEGRGREPRAGAAHHAIGLHECRHTFASLLIASGENAKAIQTFLGHATIAMTFDRYGHLMPGSRDEARRRVDAYLARAAEGSDRAGQKAAEFPNHFPTGSPQD